MRSAAVGRVWHRLGREGGSGMYTAMSRFLRAFWIASRVLLGKFGVGWHLESSLLTCAGDALTRHRRESHFDETRRSSSWSISWFTLVSIFSEVKKKSVYGGLE
ncbi:hypothetical protein BT96DRAFT_443563 [Gymnopus androsaceus JB14]|uniref:Uncharacterized protein n=1 Tax=Gymnopus androsaceus JB14 TaxID=1447944 RepID=A0A6A4GQT1_9AGAR|nr:hypothetical protein BT96DRAFT_443563 [Gymnopus androsaceus JB14]